ncbi:hypothetical protein niasHT_000028 [Heterodera trifolii]|uniref:DNA polymerase-epsilon zinc finger domain-containing protein n=1 Tax=Heterodera trifolii TaxID=157864 RepID=A0ABD2M8P4_9BILA
MRMAMKKIMPEGEETLRRGRRSRATTALPRTRSAWWRNCCWRRAARMHAAFTLQDWRCTVCKKMGSKFLARFCDCNNRFEGVLVAERLRLNFALLRRVCGRHGMANVQQWLDQVEQFYGQLKATDEPDRLKSTFTMFTTRIMIYDPCKPTQISIPEIFDRKIWTPRRLLFSRF